MRRLESGRIASVGLQLEELLQVEPDERLLARLEEEADELARPAPLARRLPPAAPEAAGLPRRGAAISGSGAAWWNWQTQGT